jgi:hypothetical protein
MAGRALRPEPARVEIIMLRSRLAYVVPLAALGVAVSLAAAPAVAATSGTFTPTGSMHVAHTQGRATLLPDGQVLVAAVPGAAVTPCPVLSCTTRRPAPGR